MEFKQHKGEWGISSWKSGANGKMSKAHYTFDGDNGLIMHTGTFWDVYHRNADGKKKFIAMKRHLKDAKAAAEAHMVAVAVAK